MKKKIKFDVDLLLTIAIAAVVSVIVSTLIMLIAAIGWSFLYSIIIFIMIPVVDGIRTWLKSIDVDTFDDFMFFIQNPTTYLEFDDGESYRLED